MDLTWGAIFKVILAGLVTYTILPAFLILRDYIIWKLIGAYILNSDLQQKLKTFVFLTNEWNTKYCVKASSSYKDGNEVYVIDGKPVSEKEFSEHLLNSSKTSQAINELDLFINRKSRFLDWLLLHYKQQGSNPIQEWKTKELESIASVKS